MVIVNAKKSSVAKILVIFLKFVFAAGLVYWLYHQEILDFTALSRIQFDRRGAVLLLLSVVSVLLAVLLVAWRLWWLLRFQHFQVSYHTVLQVTFISSFLGMILPGLVGMDALKVMYFCSRVTEKRVEAFTAVIFDRIVGLYALLLLGTLAWGVAIVFGFLPREWLLLWVVPALSVGILIAAVLLRWEAFFQQPRVQKILHFLPHHLKRFVFSVRGYLQAKPSELGWLLLVSLLVHALSVYCFYLMACLIHDTLPLIYHFVLNPLALLLMVIPLTPGGLGFSEGALAFLFQAVGSSHGALISLMGRLVMYGVFALGGIIALFFLKWHGIHVAPPTLIKNEDSAS